MPATDYIICDASVVTLIALYAPWPRGCSENTGVRFSLSVSGAPLIDLRQLSNNSLAPCPPLHLCRPPPYLCSMMSHLSPPLTSHVLPTESLSFFCGLQSSAYCLSYNRFIHRWTECSPGGDFPVQLLHCRTNCI